jgi:REP element-mobilizing transposase RayT
MSSHIHLLCKATNNFILSDVMHDFKKFTSKKIIQIINDEPDPSLKVRTGEAEQKRMDAGLL